MAGFSGSTYGAAAGYTDESLAGGGAIKGKNCTISKIEKTDGVSLVTFSWTLDDGTVKTGNMSVNDGATPLSAIVDADNHIVFTMSDGRTIDCGELPEQKINISRESGNVLEKKEDGLFVPKGAVEVSKKEGNIIKSEADGLYAATDSQVQVDFNQTDNAKADFIKNKPVVDEKYNGKSANAQSGKAVAEAISATNHLTKQIITSAEAKNYETDSTKASFNVLYLVKDASAKGTDKYLEYQRLGDETTSEFVCTGDTSTDLSGYAKSADVVAIQQKVEDKGKALIVGEDGKLILDAVGSDEAINKIYADGFASRNLCPFDSGKFNSSSWVKLDGTPATSSDYADWSIINLKKGTYTIKFGENQNVAGIQLGGDGIELISFASYTAKTFTLPNDGKIGIRIKGAGDVSYLLQIEEGEEATPYTPYSKSNVDLTAEISRKELELAELKMLGWNVPKDCPIQNDVVNNKFVQKVGRVALDNLVWAQNSGDIHAYYAQMPSDVKADEARITKGYCIGYEVKYNGEPWDASWDKIISIFLGGSCEFYNKSCDTLDAFRDTIRGKYFYYELAMPITIQIDGNELLDNFGTLCNYTEGFVIDELKNISANNDYIITDYIPVNDTDSYTIVCGHTQDHSALLAYDAGKNVIGVYSVFDRTIANFVAGTRYIRVSFTKANMSKSTIRDKNGNDLYKACKFNLEEFEKVKSAQIPTTTHTITYTTTSGTTKSLTIYGK